MPDPVWGERKRGGFFCIYVVGAVVKPSAAVGQEAAHQIKKNEEPPWGTGKPAEGERTGPAAFREAVVYTKDPGLLRLRPL